MMILCHAHFILRICAQHTVILYFCLQHTAAHKKTSLPLKNRAHPSTHPGSPRSRALRRTTAAQPCSPRRRARAGLARHAAAARRGEERQRAGEPPRGGRPRSGAAPLPRRLDPPAGSSALLLRRRAGSIRRRAQSSLARARSATVGRIRPPPPESARSGPIHSGKGGPSAVVRARELCAPRSGRSSTSPPGPPSSTSPPVGVASSHALPGRRDLRPSTTSSSARSPAQARRTRRACRAPPSAARSPPPELGVEEAAALSPQLQGREEGARSAAPSWTPRGGGGGGGGRPRGGAPEAALARTRGAARPSPARGGACPPARGRSEELTVGPIFQGQRSLFMCCGVLETKI